MNTRIKVCGLKRPEDIEAANRLRPDYIGFVFAPGKRQLSPAAAASLRAGLAPGIAAVGVFVNQNVDDVALLCRAGVIDIVQLHGDEDTPYIARLKKQICVPVIKAVPVGNALPELPAAADYLLFDTLSTQRGGNGKRFDWALLQGVRRPYFLAGGLAPANVAEAIDTLRPYAVDVSSGVETDGWKDPAKMAEFINVVRAREADRRIAT